MTLWTSCILKLPTTSDCSRLHLPGLWFLPLLVCGHRNIGPPAHISGLGWTACTSCLLANWHCTTSLHFIPTCFVKGDLTERKHNSYPSSRSLGWANRRGWAEHVASMGAENTFRILVKSDGRIKDIGHEGVDYIRLAQDRYQLWHLVYTVMDLGVP